MLPSAPWLPLFLDRISISHRRLYRTYEVGLGSLSNSYASKSTFAARVERPRADGSSGSSFAADATRRPPGSILQEQK